MGASVMPPNPSPSRTPPIYPTPWQFPFLGGFIVGMMLGGTLMALSFLLDAR